MTKTIEPAQLQMLHDRLLAAYGPQQWWPAQTRFEVLVGAVLTQNTAWTNVEQAIANLRARNMLNEQALLNADAAALARVIRPAGTYNVKARRLRALCRWFVDGGGFKPLEARATHALRRDLLAVHGVGAETADAILLYAFDRPLFVADAYARRIVSRLGWVDAGTGYEPLRSAVEAAGKSQEAGFYNELHALIVAHAKISCRPTPRCVGCALQAVCATGRAGFDLKSAGVNR